MAEQQPSIGRVVHYVSRGSADGIYISECRAAIITEVLSAESVGVFVVSPSGTWFNTVRQDEDGKAGGTWHWPERV